MTRDRVLDDLAFMIGLRLMGPSARRNYRIQLSRQLGDAAPTAPRIERLEDEERLIRGGREPVSLYDQVILRRAAKEEARPTFNDEFWRARRADLVTSGFDSKEAAQIVAAVRNSLEGRQSTKTEGATHEDLEQAA